MAIPSSWGIDKKINSMEGLSAYENGGKGSGNFGHSGRPGEIGGSGKGGMPVKVKKQDGNWQTGTVGDYDFEAKVYSEPSKFGIDGGRISKLIIRDGDGREIASYERGWGIKPEEGKGKQALDSVLEHFEPTQSKTGKSSGPSLKGKSLYEKVHMIQPGDTVHIKPQDNLPNFDKKIKVDYIQDGTIHYGSSETSDGKTYPAWAIKDITKIERKSKKNSLTEVVHRALNGGPGSGNFGHSGRPGEVGGSGKTGGYAQLSGPAKTRGEYTQKDASKECKEEFSDVYGELSDHADWIASEGDFAEGYSEEDYRKLSDKLGRISDQSSGNDGYVTQQDLVKFVEKTRDEIEPYGLIDGSASTDKMNEYLEKYDFDAKEEGRSVVGVEAYKKIAESQRRAEKKEKIAKGFEDAATKLDKLETALKKASAGGSKSQLAQLVYEAQESVSSLYFLGDMESGDRKDRSNYDKKQRELAAKAYEMTEGKKPKKLTPSRDDDLHFWGY